MLCGRAQAAYVDAGPGIVVDINAAIAADTAPNGSTATAGFRVNSDGTVDKREDSTYTQVNSGTDWRIPNGSGAGYYVRFTKGVLDPTPTVGGLTLGTWYEITSNREVSWALSTNDTLLTTTLTVELGTDGSTADVSANMTCTMTVGTPI